MKKVARVFLEAGVLGAGLGLVIITLSGSTRDVATALSVASVALFLGSQLLGED